MLSRRRFLQSLLSMPLLASIPALAQVVDQLPEVEPVEELFKQEYQRGWWLKINGKPMACSSISIDSSCETIDAWDMERQMPNVYRGLMRNSMSVELESLDGVPELFYQRDELLIEAKMGPATVKATGLITSVSQLAVGETDYRNTLTIELFRVDYEVT